ncbi:MAG: polysaccharide biosynthesis protein [Candidatus Izemoplasmatales bacterium]
MSNKRFFKKAKKRNLRLFFMLVDIFGIALTYTMAIFALKFMIPTYDISKPFILLPFVIIFKLAFYYAFKLYHLILDNVGLDEVFKIGWVVTLTNLIIIVITLSIPNFDFIPEVYFIFTTLLEFGIVLVPRIAKRIMGLLVSKAHYYNGNRTLIVGAGAGAKIALNEIRNNPEMNNNIVGFIDDDERKIGNLLSGYPIFGPISEINSIINRMDIEEVIIAIVNIEPEKFQEIVNYIIDKPIKIKRLPAIKDYKDDLSDHIYEVNVEDLLSRDVIKLDSQGIAEFISKKKVLITGAGGSIGSELVRQIIKYRPRSILMVDIYENDVYNLLMEINMDINRGVLKPLDIKIQIASVYNYNRMKHIVSEYLPDYIFHAAAYKHVPLMENSPQEAIRTNILGTYNMCKLANEFNIKKFVLVSSDKAVRPTNVMGATKRYAEMIIQHFDKHSKTSFSAVRFGNVLGSNGSVVPLFKKQISHGGPVTVTDMNIIRYFMTIPEAVSLILQSAAFARGGEIFILDMGEPVKIIDLAEKMILLSGLKPYVDIQIKVTGLRPGEKLYEELLIDKETNIKTENKLIFIEKVEDHDNIEKETEILLNEFEELSDNKEVKHLIKRFVKTYTIDEKK